MSYDAIAHLDFQVDAGAGLRDRALGAWEAYRQETVHGLLVVAQKCIHETLEVMNASNVEVKPRDRDGDGEVFCEIDGMKFKVAVTFPVGGGDKPALINLAVKTGNNWTVIYSLESLGKHLASGTVNVEGGES